MPEPASDPAAGGPVLDGRRRRWAEHRVTRRAEFVAAGAEAVDRFGPEASAEQIAAVAGVSRTVLYRYFRDREDLRRAVADHVVNAVVGSVAPHLVLSADATPRQIIAPAVAVIFAWLDEHPNLYYFLRSRRSGPGLDAVENTLAARVSELLKLVLVLFGLDGAQAEPSAFGIVGMVESVGSWWLARRSLPREEIVDIVCVGVWNLLSGPARANGLAIGYDEPLPWHQLSAGARP